MTCRARVIAVGLFVALSTQVGLVHAGPDEDRAGARAAATEGAKAIEEGRYEQAIDLFTRAETLVHAPPHLVYMARAYVKLGKLVRASETYLKVTRETLPSTAPKAFGDAQAVANDELATLKGRIPNIKIEVVGEAKNLVVTMDGVEVPKALYGVAHPIDPGEHVFMAKAEGKESASTTKNILERSEETVHLTLTQATNAAGSTPSRPAMTSTDTKSSHGSSPLRAGAFVGWGVGMAGLAVGTVFLLKNRSSREESRALCPNDRCPSSARATVEVHDDDADRAATASWLGYGVGIAGLAAGTVMYFMSSTTKQTPSTAGATSLRPSVRPIVGLSSLGFQGEF